MPLDLINTLGFLGLLVLAAGCKTDPTPATPQGSEATMTEPEGPPATEAKFKCAIEMLDVKDSAVSFRVHFNNDTDTTLHLLRTGRMPYILEEDGEIVLAWSVQQPDPDIDYVLIEMPLTEPLVAGATRQEEFELAIPVKVRDHFAGSGSDPSSLKSPLQVRAACGFLPYAVPESEQHNTNYFTVVTDQTIANSPTLVAEPDTTPPIDPKTELSPLTAVLSPADATFSSTIDGHIDATIRNDGPEPIVIQMDDLGSTILSLEVLDAKGERIPTIPPGFPSSAAEREKTKETLAPGETRKVTYTLHMFSPPLPPGTYSARMRRMPSEAIRFTISPEP